MTANPTASKHQNPLAIRGASIDDTAGSDVCLSSFRKANLGKGFNESHLLGSEAFRRVKGSENNLTARGEVAELRRTSS